MQTLVKVRKHVPSGTIIMDRPDKRNALSRLMMIQLKEAFRDLHQERKVRAVILTGSGAAFCAGADLAEIRATSQESDAWEQWHRDAVLYKELIETMLLFPKPIIAAVNGPAVAGGAGLVMAADLSVATPQAMFGFPEARRGLVAGLVAPLLTFRVGASLAAKLLLSARLISATEAAERGFYQELTDSETIWARAHELAQECAKSAPEALQLTKKMLNETIGEHLGTLLSAGAAASAASRTTEAAEEGLAAFLEKREPQWL